MAANEWLMQTLADQLQVAVERPTVLETTAWGAARLAGLHAGIYPMLGEPGARRVEKTFAPRVARAESDRLHAGWLRAVRRVRGDESPVSR
jgi:glycerol kinase